jgi:uncharacterized protein (TIGR02646 family)
LISITRGPKPDVLDRNEVAWTEEFATAVDAKAKPLPARYRDPEVKVALKAESHGKCVYCESKIAHVYWGDVEHILPKMRVPNLVVQWDNLAFVCAVCNNNKRDYYEPDEPLLNPYIDDPDDFIRFTGPIVDVLPTDNGRGLVTIGKIELDRTELFERRRDRIQTIRGLLARWAQVKTAPAKDAVWSLVEREISDDTEYAGCARQYVRDVMASLPKP